jgi:HPt (histidine-containing phosphotransfer) domain-containing protein
LASSQEDRQALAGLNAGSQRNEIREMAHRIKGAARIIRASKVIDTCESLEAACASASDADLISSRGAVERAMRELEDALAQRQASAGTEQ